MFAGQFAGAQSEDPRSGQRLDVSRREESREDAVKKTRTISGRVVDERGEPITGASVIATPAGAVTNHALMFATLRSMVTDETGAFSFDRLGPGAYYLTPFAPGYVPSPATDEDRFRPICYRPGDSPTVRMLRGGVITGTVRNAPGEPVVGVRVKATLVRDLDGRRPGLQSVGILSLLIAGWVTDDRGVYRLWGLAPGVYVVCAGGTSALRDEATGGSAKPYESDAPTYYPSTTRAAASELTLHSGEEIGDVEIKYRGNRGFTVSGTISGALRLNSSTPPSIRVVLTENLSGTPYAQGYAYPTGGFATFVFDGVPDGEYTVSAMAGFGMETEHIAASRPHRFVVKGADTGGVHIELTPLGSIAGRIVLEKRPEDGNATGCRQSPARLLTDAVVTARADLKDKDAEQSPTDTLRSLLGLPFLPDSVPDEKGGFKIRPLSEGLYRIATNPPSEDWYLRSISMGEVNAQKRRIDAGLNGISLKAGEEIKDVSVVLSEGAAGLRGRVVPQREGKTLPYPMRVYLVPAEVNSEVEILRYAEADVREDASFAFSNLVPGQYWLMARQHPERDTADNVDLPVAWDAEARKKLRKEAEATKTLIDLKPCQRTENYVVQYYLIQSPSKQGR